MGEGQREGKQRLTLSPHSSSSFLLTVTHPPLPFSSSSFPLSSPLAPICRAWMPPPSTFSSGAAGSARSTPSPALCRSCRPWPSKGLSAPLVQQLQLQLQELRELLLLEGLQQQQQRMPLLHSAPPTPWQCPPPPSLQPLPLPSCALCTSSRHPLPRTWPSATTACLPARRQQC